MRKKFIWYESAIKSWKKRSIRRKIMEPIVRLFIKCADAYITYNSATDDSLIKYYGVDRSSIFRAQNTIDTERLKRDAIRYRPKVAVEADRLKLQNSKVISYIGGIEKRKRVEWVPKATIMLRELGHDVKALIIGDGPDEEWLRKKMSDEESEHTVFVGRKVEDRALFLLMSDVIVLPDEGGLAVVDAMTLGIPFVGASSIENGGIRDYVIDGETGFLFQPGDLQEFVRCLERIVSDGDLKSKLSENSMKHSENFTIEKMVDGIEKAIKTIYGVYGNNNIHG